MNPNKALWEKGDFTRIAQSMRDSGEELVDTLGITTGLQVLDLGCGDGTTALPAARRGAQVLGIDIALSDDSFDLVVTIFGAMFAPRPFDVAKEIVRVTRPGGRIVMGNWIPNDTTLVAQLLKTSAAYSPPPPEGFVSPVTWGLKDNVLERYAAAGISPERISLRRETYRFVSPAAPAQLVAAFRSYYGPTMNAFEAAESAGRADALQDELEVLFDSQNTGENGGTSIPATYLRVEVAV
jgi:SAM-dependent methyltransferase